jgi:hypothetical protein
MSETLENLVRVLSLIIEHSSPETRHLYYPLLQSVESLIDLRHGGGRRMNEMRLLEHHRARLAEFLSAIAANTSAARAEYDEACRAVAEFGLREECIALSASVRWWSPAERSDTCAVRRKAAKTLAAGLERELRRSRNEAPD